MDDNIYISRLFDTEEHVKDSIFDRYPIDALPERKMYKVCFPVNEQNFA